MQHYFHFLTFSISVFLFSDFLAAEPEQGDSKQQNIFQQLDKNSDGIVNATEVPADKKRFFDHLIRSADKNKDGKLSQDEFQSGLKKEEQKFPVGEPSRRNRDPRGFQMMLSRLDKNGDKKISRDELPEPLRERLEPLFDRLNKEEISLEEFRRYMGRFRGMQKGDENQKTPQGKRDAMFDGASRFFDTLDANKDGKLTLDEAPERGKQILRRILERSGKEKDSELSKKEFMETMAAFRPGRRPDGREGGKEMKKPEGRDKEQSGRDNAPRRRPATELMLALDSNRDGTLSKDELKKIGQVFDQLDQNKDGVLDPSEIGFRRDRSTSTFRNRGQQGRNRSKGANRKSDTEKKNSQE